MPSLTVKLFLFEVTSLTVKIFLSQNPKFNSQTFFAQSLEFNSQTFFLQKGGCDRTQRTERTGRKKWTYISLFAYMYELLKACLIVTTNKAINFYMNKSNIFWIVRNLKDNDDTPFIRPQSF